MAGMVESPRGDGQENGTAAGQRDAAGTMGPCVTISEQECRLFRESHVNIERHAVRRESMTRFVIVGGGSAGVQAAKTLRSLRSDDPIALISEEERPFYARPLLADFAAGRCQEADLWTHFESTAAAERITLHLGRTVTRLDYRHSREIVLDDGTKLPYDMLLLATGVKPVRPEVPGVDLNGVTLFSAYADAVKVRQWAEQARSAIVFGRGLPAIELTRALRLRGLEVTLLVPDESPWFLPLFDTSEERIEAILRHHGVKVVVLDAPTEIVGEGGQAQMVRTREGRELPADIVGIAADQKAATDFLSGSDIGSDEGILVGEHLGSTDERIFAAGDVAQIQPQAGRRVLGYGSVRARLQGDTAARNMCGDSQKAPVGDETSAASLYGLSLADRWQ
jgi:NAD(P)H-nitrite reductase large subunit